MKLFSPLAVLALLFTGAQAVETSDKFGERQLKSDSGDDLGKWSVVSALDGLQLVPPFMVRWVYSFQFHDLIGCFSRHAHQIVFVFVLIIIIITTTRG